MSNPENAFIVAVFDESEKNRFHGGARAAGRPRHSGRVLFFVCALCLLILPAGCGGGGGDIKETIHAATTHISDSESQSGGTRLGLGGAHACYIAPDGALYCWGDNSAGQLGTGDKQSQGAPARVQGLSGVAQVAGGMAHTCAVTQSGAVYCWGGNGVGQLGVGDTENRSVPVQVAGISNAVHVETGWTSSCALLADGTVKCWGSGNLGASGNGTSGKVPVAIAGISGAKALSMNALTACALVDSGVQCWTSGQPKDMPDTAVFASLDVGDGHYCGMVKSGHVILCAGYNTNGQTGGSDDVYTTIMPIIQNVSNPRSVATGAYFTCAVDQNGGAWCWGSNSVGQLGDGASQYPQADPKDFHNTPVAVQGLSNVVEIAAPSLGSYACARTRDESIYCWGNNLFGQLGIGVQKQGSLPGAVWQVNDVKSTFSGVSHACAVTEAGALYCWGQYYAERQLNDAQKQMPGNPYQETQIADAVAGAAGYSHTCVVTGAGTVLCWGENKQGCLGVPEGQETPGSAVQVGGLSGSVQSLALGNGFSCALLSGGAVQCWGANGKGQLGNGATSSSATPVNVSGLSGAVAITAGYSHACALLSSGAVQCWGANSDGELGNNGYSSSSTPVSVQNITNALKIDATYKHTCAVLSDGTVTCWGDNQSGQIGGDSYGYRTPYPIPDISTAADVATGRVHTCVLLQNGTVTCWGDYLNVGDDSGTHTTITGLPASTAIMASWALTCATGNDKKVYCWGGESGVNLGRGPDAALTPEKVLF